jgi:hypothetical protein
VPSAGRRTRPESGATTAFLRGSTGASIGVKTGLNRRGGSKTVRILYIALDSMVLTKPAHRPSRARAGASQASVQPHRRPTCSETLKRGLCGAISGYKYLVQTKGLYGCLPYY